MRPPGAGRSQYLRMLEIADTAPGGGRARVVECPIHVGACAMARLVQNARWWNAVASSRRRHCRSTAGDDVAGLMPCMTLDKTRAEADALAPFRHRDIGMVDDPAATGKGSNDALMVLAVTLPPQEPVEGQAGARCLEIGLAQASGPIGADRREGGNDGKVVPLPAARLMVPPLDEMPGRWPARWPSCARMFLSQPPMTRMPSSHWPCTLRFRCFRRSLARNQRDFMTSVPLDMGHRKWSECRRSGIGARPGRNQ